MRSKLLAAAVVALLVPGATGCPRKKQPADAAVELTLWHTFNPEETATLNQVLDRIRSRHPDWRVRSTVIPFAHAQNAFRRAAGDCSVGAPDVFRAELPWLPELVSRGLLRPLPVHGDLELPPQERFLQPAQVMARHRGTRWALPANVDCLALFFNRTLVARPPATIDQLVEFARRLTVDHRGFRPDRPGFDPLRVDRWGLYVRADGYWFLPFLWAAGGDLLDPDSGEVFVDQPIAVRALEHYRDLVTRHHVAPRPSPSNDYEDQQRRFGRGEVAMIVNGPWAVGALLAQPAFADNPAALGVAPFPRGTSAHPAPLSAHGWVVSRCSRPRERQAWQLAAELSSREAQARFARDNLLLPALRDVPPPPAPEARRLFQGLQAALASARPRPSHPVMARIFDDFNPAVQAVVLGGATADEALAGVARAWRRLLRPAAAASRPSTSTPRQ